MSVKREFTPLKSVSVTSNVLCFVLLSMLALPYHAFAQSSDPGIECLNTLADKPAFALLKDKVMLGTPVDPPFRMLASKGVPTKAEAAVLVKWMDARGECYKLREPAPLAIQQNVARADAELQSLALGLIDGKIRYGEFARRRVESDLNLSAEQAKIRDADRAEQARAAEAERAEQARVKEAERAEQARIKEEERAARAEQTRMWAAAESAERAKKAQKCALASHNVDTFCGRQTGVTVNVGPYGSTTSGGSFDASRAINCGFWQAEQIQVCR